MATHHRGTPEEVRALNLLINLMRCAKAVGERLEGREELAGLSENQFGALEILLHLGTLRPNEIGDKLFTSRPNVTLLLDALEKKGLVERRRCTGDRRQIDVHLTAAGRAFIEPRFARHARSVVDEMSVLTAREQEEAARLLKKLGLQKPGARDT